MHSIYIWGGRGNRGADALQIHYTGTTQTLHRHYTDTVGQVTLPLADKSC